MIEEEHTRKTQQAPSFNPEDDVSFESNYMMLKVIIYTSLFVYGVYKLNQIAMRRLERRQARLDGRLDEFLKAEDNEYKRSWRHKILGDMGRREIDGGITMTSIGGEWELIDLKGNAFGSKTLKGHYYLLFFGSSMCPDTCPYTLMKTMNAHRQIDRQSEGEQYCGFIPVFVATNSKYDTKDAL